MHCMDDAAIDNDRGWERHGGMGRERGGLEEKTTCMHAAGRCAPVQLIGERGRVSQVELQLSSSVDDDDTHIYAAVTAS
jgi:hypothetical protein